MISLKPATTRGTTHYDWLESRHSFSFGHYFDPQAMGFRDLRVINEDWVAPSGGFPTHPHRDMEIVTYVVNGALQHRDSMGNGSVIQAGDIQYMSAGTGITHSEFNPSDTDSCHLLQIWLLPNEGHATPRYGQRSIPREELQNRLALLVHPQGKGGSLAIRSNASIHAARLAAGQTLRAAMNPQGYAWLQLITGGLTVAGQALGPGDALAIAQEPALEIAASADAEFLLFELA